MTLLALRKGNSVNEPETETTEPETEVTEPETETTEPETEVNDAGANENNVEDGVTEGEEPVA